MNTKKIFEYVMKTPHNTNANILASMLSEPTSWNDLKDKPFGEEVTEVELLPETTIDFTRLEDGRTSVDKIEVAVGDICSVIWDGKEYNCEVFEFFGQAMAMGDVYTATGGAVGAVGTESTGEPFMITTDGNTSTMIAALYDCGIVTISISKRAETIKTIDEKYLPALTSPSGKKFKLTVDDSGNITATEV